MPMSMAKIEAQHYGRDGWDGHRGSTDFDFYCVAHGEDYSPKYMDGAVCHDGMDEGWCHPDCIPCSVGVPCPIKPCPLTGEEPDAARTPSHDTSSTGEERKA